MKKVKKIKQFLNTKNGRRIGILGAIFLMALILYLPFSLAGLEPVKSVIITSEKTDYESSEAGSWQVEKSGKWIKKGTAQVSFDVDTTLKTNNKYTDIIFVLDISGSMSGEKLERVKSDTTELIESLLSNSNNRAALITFDSTSSIISNLTNDKDTLLEKVNNLQDTGSTNYYQALVNVDSILKDYEKENGREMIVLFLTDGYPNIDTPNEETQYQYLKQQYPYATINGIQYEMGSSILNPIKKISDNQFTADMETLNNVLFDASVAPITYEKYEIVDYIDNNYFTLDSEEDIKVSQGKVKLEEENGKQKITWTISDLKSGSSANLTMELKLKEEYIGEGGVYPTNEKEEIISKIESQEEDVTSTKTPILADNYQVIYDGNAPEGCTVKNVPSNAQHSVFDTVEISSEEPTCDGYQFKGWEIVTKDITKVNDDYFIMPEEDVTIRATWSEFKLAKSMDGTISKVQTLYKIMQDQSVMDNEKSEFVSSSSGINFGNNPSDTNGKGVYTRAGTENDKYPIYYYRGEVDNNHVKFAGFCWKAVRTTSTGGVKLIYDGVPDENGYCNNTGEDSTIGDSAFNSNYTSPADVGYMYGTRYAYSSKSSSSLGTVVYGNNVTWDGSQYTLVDTIESSNWSSDRTNLAKKYHYTCLSTGNTCSSVYYIHYFGSSSSIYYLTLKDGKDIEDAKTEMFTNTTDSKIKTTIDKWYQENMTEYTQYLEDTVWCNDRSFYSGSLKSKDTNAGTGNNYFGAYGRNVATYKPDLSCPNKSDELTVGGGSLTYPVALLTADEITLAGSGWSGYSSKAYLNIGDYWWSVSPYHFHFYNAYGFIVYSSGSLDYFYVYNAYGVRPSVSLAPGIMINNGDGTSEAPYELELEE